MNLNTRSRELMEVVYNFKYLGAWTKCSQTEFKLWKGMACHTAIGWRKSGDHNCWSRWSCVCFLQQLNYFSYMALKLGQSQKRWRKRWIIATPGCLGWLAMQDGRVTQQTLNCMELTELDGLAEHLIQHEEEIANKLVLRQSTERKTDREKQHKTLLDNRLQETYANNEHKVK